MHVIYAAIKMYAQTSCEMNLHLGDDLQRKECLNHPKKTPQNHFHKVSSDHAGGIEFFRVYRINHRTNENVSCAAALLPMTFYY